MQNRGYDRIESPCDSCSTFYDEKNGACIKCLQKITYSLLGDSGTFKQAIHKWGKEAQCMTAIGEMGELLDAMIKFWRGQSNSTFDMTDELADVLIMSMQLSILLGPEEVAERIDAKLDKLNHRLLK